MIARKGNKHRGFGNRTYSGIQLSIFCQNFKKRSFVLYQTNWQPRVPVCVAFNKSVQKCSKVWRRGSVATPDPYSKLKLLHF